jgi:hypothetical protein
MAIAADFEKVYTIGAGLCLILNFFFIFKLVLK